eukprot:103575_1
MIILRCSIYGLSISVYIVWGIVNHQTFPWFICDTFTINDNIINTAIVIIWLFIFLCQACFIYIDTLNKMLGFSYVALIYQTIFCAILDQYYGRYKYPFLQYVHYASTGCLLFGVALICSLGRYALPARSIKENLIFCGIVVCMYTIIFIAETCFGSIIGSKLISKICELLLMFGFSARMTMGGRPLFFKIRKNLLQKEFTSILCINGDNETEN